MSEPPRPGYRTPRDEEGGGRLVIQALAGCVLTCGLVVGTVIAVLLMMAARSTEYDRVSWMIGLTICGGVLGALILLSIWARRRPAQRGWAMGIWIGLGVACLIEGLCFAGFVRVGG